MRLRLWPRPGPLSTACLWHIIIVAVLAACSPAAPLRPTTALEVGVTASMPAHTETLPPATTGITPASTETAAESPLQPVATEAFVSTPTARLANVDQASVVDTSRTGWWSIQTLGPIGQTFRPSFAGLD